jgi:hypothetical protein
MILDGFGSKQLNELKSDLLNTRTTLVTRGWAPGYLINYFEDDAATKGKVCMTGAAGCAVEGETFVEWVMSRMTKMANGYRWRKRSHRLLRFLAEVGAEKYHTGYSTGSISYVLNTIYNINDSKLGTQTEALAWVDDALSRVDARLEELKTPAPTPTPVKVESATPMIERLFEQAEQEVEIEKA